MFPKSPAVKPPIMRHMFHAKALLMSNLMVFLFACKTVVIFGLHASRDLLLCNTDFVVEVRRGCVQTKAC